MIHGLSNALCVAWSLSCEMVPTLTKIDREESRYIDVVSRVSIPCREDA